MSGIIERVYELDGQLVADVKLDGDERRFVFPIASGLLAQWGADAVRAYLLQAAASVIASERERAAAVDAHQAIAGAGIAAPVCREGHIECQDAHAPKGCGRACTVEHAHHYDPGQDA